MNPQGEEALRYKQYKLEIKSVDYSSQGSHTDQLDFCIWLADDSTEGECDQHYTLSSLLISYINQT